MPSPLLFTLLWQLGSSVRDCDVVLLCLKESCRALAAFADSKTPNPNEANDSMGVGAATRFRATGELCAHYLQPHFGCCQRSWERCV